MISSCDAYADAWQPFFVLFNRYWPDCPYPITLVSNHRRFDAPNVRCLTLGEDRGWASNLSAALASVPAKRILYLQEDYFLQSPVDTQKIAGLVDFAAASGAGYIRLCGAPDPDLPHDNEFGLGLLSSHLQFRLSLQAALWDRDTLQRLLVPGENGWQMEIDGSQRSATLDTPFFGTFRRRPLIDYYFYTAILKGKWVPGALRLCRREGVAVDRSHRETHSEWPFIVRSFRNLPAVQVCQKYLRRVRKRNPAISGS